LQCRNLTKRGVFNDISFDLHAGEILCITGLIGSKRTELLHAIFGSDRFDSGALAIDGKSVNFLNPSAAIASGIGLVPEDRHREGLMLGLSVSSNLIMATLRRFEYMFLLNRSMISAAGRASIASLNIQPPDSTKVVRLLSGGNQQKVLLGKWLNLGPRVLILDEPTVGVDVGAKAEIYAILRAECNRGVAVLVVSSDLEEVMTISDRIAVMVQGRLTGIYNADKTSHSLIIEKIGGVTTA
jgi:ABC-type sugar transport system ATPase subunit